MEQSVKPRRSGAPEDGPLDDDLGVAVDMPALAEEVGLDAPDGGEGVAPADEDLLMPDGGKAGDLDDSSIADLAIDEPGAGGEYGWTDGSDVDEEYGWTDGSDVDEELDVDLPVATGEGEDLSDGGEQGVEEPENEGAADDDPFPDAGGEV